MRWVAIALLAWIAQSYINGVGQKPAPLFLKPAPSVEDCHCFIEPNHGLYK